MAEHVFELRDAARLTTSETFYNARGRRIRYHLTGAEAAPPTVVLLCGAMASLEQWDRVQTALGASTRAFSYDRDGTGFSDAQQGHDTNAEVDELDQLLRSREFAAPFVLVSFSSSAMIATVFAARHRDVVKGIVFVDPITRSTEPGAKSIRRILWRPALINPIEAFFGYTRLKHALMSRQNTATSLDEERSDAILVSAHHWLAGSRNALHLDEDGEQADAAMAGHPFADLPLALVTAADPAHGDYFRVLLERQKKLAASSKLGIVRAVHGDHSELLNDPVAVGAVVDMIHAITEQVRAKGAAGTLDTAT